MRVGFVHTPNPDTKHIPGLRLSTLIYKLLMESGLHMLSPDHFRTILPELTAMKDNLDTDGHILSAQAQRVFGDTPLHAFSSSGWGVAETSEASQFWESVGSDIVKKLKLRSASPHLVMNGRVSRRNVLPG